jgi:uncharacterized LabA/DUF88 family protein
MSTAILVDGGFFLRCLRRVYKDIDPHDPVAVAKKAHEMALDHLRSPRNTDRKDLYRIFFYDCPPLVKRVHGPISKKSVNFGASPTAQFRHSLHEELKKLRKVALRLGRLSEYGAWRLKPDTLKPLLEGSKTFASLTEEDFEYDVRQKGVDIRIGLDIASLTFKKQVDQIVLVSGDSDFVPAAKLARREGIDFILDPMWQLVAPDLYEHIDGLRSTCPKPRSPSDGAHDR